MHDTRGRAAEQAFFGKISTGAADDLNKVTKLAYAINSIYGMGSAIGKFFSQQITATQLQLPERGEPRTSQRFFRL